MELPFGDEPVSSWIDGSGAIHDRPVADADPLPGRFVLPGLADAHAHPAIGSGPGGPVPLDATAARSNLTAWAHTGIALVREVGCSWEYCLASSSALPPRSAGIKVDAYRQRIRAHRCRRGHAQAARQVALADTPPPLARIIIVQNVCRSGSPADA